MDHRTLLGHMQRLTRVRPDLLPPLALLRRAERRTGRPGACTKRSRRKGAHARRKSAQRSGRARPVRWTNRRARSPVLPPPLPLPPSQLPALLLLRHRRLSGRSPCQLQTATWARRSSSHARRRPRSRAESTATVLRCSLTTLTLTLALTLTLTLTRTLTRTRTRTPTPALTPALTLRCCAAR